MRSLVAVVATVIGVVTWATARSVRRYEADIADRNAAAVIDAAEREVRLAYSKTTHPSNRGGRPPTPDGRKLAVLDAYERHGIDAAMHVSGVKERWTRELVKQAKELRNRGKS